MFYDIINYFPYSISVILQQELKSEEDLLEEIRLRTGKSIILKYNNKEIITDYKVTSKEILEILQIISENSIYSYQKEIAEGFITVRGGHRIGVTGNCVIENNKVININYISSLNFRIARQVIGCSNDVIESIIDKDKQTIFNTLIISLPGSGKTTLLRDIIRSLSNGIKSLEGQTIGVVDERGELAASYKGIPQNDIGPRTDVLSNIPKSIGIKMLIRSMAPKIIAADEIGNLDDIEAIQDAISSGIKIIATAHGENLEDVKKNKTLKEILDLKMFKRIIFLKSSGERGKVEKINSIWILLQRFYNYKSIL